jgi:MYXO-CTERM domain-containing protein
MRIGTRTVLGFLVGTACLSSSAWAAAQNVTVSTVVRRYVGGKEVQPRAAGLNPTAINFDDCDKDMTLEFSVTQAGVDANTKVQVWVGQQQCTDKTAREGATQQCWKVRDDLPVVIGAQAVPIRVRSIVSEIKNQGATPVNPGPEVCSKGSTGLRSYNIQFLPIGTDNSAVGTGGSYPINAKLFGPAAVSNVSVVGGDTLLTAKWTVPADTTILGFNVYCDPPVGKEDIGRNAATPAATDAQTTTKVLVCPDTGAPVSSDAASDGDAELDAQPTDAGADACYEETRFLEDAASSSGGGPTAGGGTCTSSVLVPKQATSTSSGEGGTQLVGAPTSIPDEYKCGGATGANVPSANVSGLRNGFDYAIAVAAYDAYGNAGLLAGPVCGTPEQTDDFWDRYRAAGGGAGGSFCGCEAVGMPTGSAVIWLGAMGLGVALVRRRRKR